MTAMQTAVTRTRVIEVGVSVAFFWTYSVFIASVTSFTSEVDGKMYFCSGEVYWENPLARRLSAAV